MIAVVAAWIALLYGVSWHLVGGTSDNAAAVLAGRDMMHGNVVLHGWHLAADSFWLLDLPLLGLEAKFGLGPDTFHVVPTLVAAATVLTAMAFAARQANRRNAVIAALGTFLVIGLPSSLFGAYFLQATMHVVTTLCCLLAFALLAPRRSRTSQVGGSFLLAIAVSSDPFAVAIGVVPVVVAGLAVCRTRQPREGVPLVAGGVLAAIAGEGLARAVTAVGGFRRLPTLALAAPSRWVPNLHLAVHDFVYMFGVRVLPRWPSVAWPARLIHVVGLVFAGAAVALGLLDLTRRLLVGRGRGTWIDDVCVVGFVGSVVFFVMVVFPGENVSRARYLLPATVFGAILAGRLAGALIGSVLDGVSERATSHMWTSRVSRAVAAALVVVLVAGYAAETGASARSENPPNPAVALAAWLSAHHLTNGWGGYWDATVTTVASHNNIRIRPVIGVGGRLHAFGNLASATWFAPTGSHREPATFLVYEPTSPWGNVNLATATATFGEPVKRARVGGFEVLVWDHDTNPQVQKLVVQ